LGDGFPIVNITRGEPEGQKVAILINDKMKLEAIKPESRTPTNGGLAAFSYVFENLV